MSSGFSCGHLRPATFEGTGHRCPGWCQAAIAIAMLLVACILVSPELLGGLTDHAEQGFKRWEYQLYSNYYTWLPSGKLT